MSDEIIQLNVGGRLMTTTRSTLTKCKDSLLEKMFDKDSPFAPARRIDDAYFIDEDPDIFSAILTWLRHGVVERKSLSTEHLMAAAAYFGLEDLRRSVGEAEAEEEVPAEPVVKAKRPVMFPPQTLDGFKAPRVPRHKALTGRNSPPRPPRQVPSFHHKGEKSLQLTNM